MALNDILKNLTSEPVEVSHDCEVDIGFFVTANYRLHMEAINREEQEAITEDRTSLNGETDRETILSTISNTETFYNDRRVDARNIALVSLIIRLHYWVATYARRLDANRERGKPLRTELGFLSSKLPKRPVDEQYFYPLVAARD